MARKTKKRVTMFEKGMEFTSVADAQATYNKAMVMVWDDMQTQIPICAPELVK